MSTAPCTHKSPADTSPASSTAAAATDTRADPDFDGAAQRLLWSLRNLSDIRRHWLLCHLYYNAEYRDLGSRRLHAVADALRADNPFETLLADTLRLLAELDAIARLGVEGAGRSEDARLCSKTAALFGQPREVLSQGIEACLREHYDGGRCLCRYRRPMVR